MAVKDIVQKLSGAADFECETVIVGSAQFFQLIEALSAADPPKEDYSAEFNKHVAAKKRAKIFEVFTQALTTDEPPFAEKLSNQLYLSLLEKI